MVIKYQYTTIACEIIIVYDEDLITFCDDFNDFKNVVINNKDIIAFVIVPVAYERKFSKFIKNKALTKLMGVEWRYD